MKQGIVDYLKQINNMSENKPQKKRKSSSGSAQKSFHSIQEFWADPLDAQLIGRRAQFPFRPAVNILLIIFTTIQVFLLINSRIYLRGDLVRTFLSVYIDENNYPGLFNGEEFYLKMINIQELSDHLDYAFTNINTVTENSFIDMYYNNSRILLHVEYSNRIQAEKKESTFEINPKIGIVEPFNMRNTTDFQIFLLQVERFEIRVTNLTVKEEWEGFTQQYVHVLSYSYQDSIQMAINFRFEIDNAMMDQNNEDQLTESGDQLKEGHTFPILYIVKLRIFYGFVLILAFLSLYLNYLFIKRTFSLLYESLSDQSHQPVPLEIATKQKRLDNILDENTEQKKSSISQWIKANQITLEQLKFQHYIHIIQFDIIFSTLSNVFEIIAGFYLIYGIEKERVAGIACLLSWMTIFRFVRQNKKLVLMYELIKLSITKVIKFFVEFFPAFIAYAILGVCLFPKVSFFSSLSDSVTTLVCLMMGDSIQMITQAMTQKNSIILTMLYIFTFVLLFMHAIHNTLTSLIKQFFISMKIDLILKEKQSKKQEDKYVYLQQRQLESDKIKKKLPLKLTPSLQSYILRKDKLEHSMAIIKKIQYLFNNFQLLMMIDTNIIDEDQCFTKPLTVSKQKTKNQIIDELERRKKFLLQKLKQLQIKFHQYEGHFRERDQGIKESLLTENDKYN